MQAKANEGPIPFQFKLYEMLQTSDESVISWQPSGGSFMIRNTKKFVEEVIPR